MNNAKKSIATGALLKITTHIMPFLVQTALIHGMGMEYVGLQGVFGSILSVLSVAELGIGSAIVYSMYEPIATDDIDSICALLSYYKRVYRTVGTVIFFLGLIIMPFVGGITGKIDGVNIYIVFFLYLINSVLSYFLYAYKSSLLIAHQRTDISNEVGIVISFAMSLFQIVAIMCYRNFYIHLSVAIVFTMISNVWVSKNVDRLYPEYKSIGVISDSQHEEIKKNVKGLMVAKVCGISRNMFDSIFISAFLGIVMAGIYSNYFYVLNTVSALLSVIVPSIIGGVGNSIKLDSVEKNYSDMTRIDFVYMIVSGWCTVAMLCLYQPFMKIWAGEDNMFSFDIVILFSLYFYIRQMGSVRAIYSDAAGLFWENRYRTIAEAVANVVLNMALVRIWGVRGIVLATILTLFFIGYLGSAEVLFRCFFKKGLRLYLINHMKYLLVTFVISVFTYLICYLIQGNIWVVFGLRIIICAITPTILYWIVYHRSVMFKDFGTFVRKKDM